MMNKNGKCMNKLAICLNVLLHYDNYKKLVGRQVEIIKNDGLPKYDDLIGKIGYVYDFEFVNFKKPLIVHFPKTKEKYCFGINELKLYRR